MAADVYELSIEEVAVLLTLLVGVREGETFLEPLIGSRDEVELAGRRLAAAHSLIARGYLRVHGETPEVRRNVADVVEPVGRAPVALVCVRTEGTETSRRDFYVGDDLSIETQIVRAVVCRLETLGTTGDVVERVRAFFAVDRSATGPDGVAAVVVRADALPLTADGLSTATPDTLRGSLEAAGVSSAVAGEIARDMQAASHRGTVMRVERRDGAATATDVVLLLGPAERRWLVAPAGEPGMIAISRFTPARFLEAVERFAASSRPAAGRRVA